MITTRATKNLQQRFERHPWLAAFVFGLALRVILPWFSHGFRYMDEHWQVIEPANYLLHGVWARTWEWETQNGGRSWIYPWLVSQPMRLAEWLGILDPVWINAFVRMFHGILASLSVPLAWFAVRAMGSTQSAKWAAWTIAVWPFALFCGFHTHGEMIGALFVLGGVAFPTLSPTLIQNEARAFLLSGACFGVALVLKIDAAVAGLAFGVWQLIHLRWRRAVWLAAGVAPFVLLLGWIDYLTWDRWFQSVRNHGYANLVEEIGNTWGVSPWYMHTVFFYNIVGIPVLIAMLLLPWVWKKLPDALKTTWFLNAFFIAVFSSVEHKEKRFMASLVYTGLVAGFATFPYAGETFLQYFDLRKLLQKKSELSVRGRVLAIVCWLVFIGHFVADIDNSILRRPWWDRIWAMQQANQIPGIEKVFFHQWPAPFFLSRTIPGDALTSDREALRKATAPLRNIGIATEYGDTLMWQDFGFKCTGYPSPRPIYDVPIPWAFHCVRESR